MSVNMPGSEVLKDTPRHVIRLRKCTVATDMTGDFFELRKAKRLPIVQKSSAAIQRNSKENTPRIEPIPFNEYKARRQRVIEMSQIDAENTLALDPTRTSEDDASPFLRFRIESVPNSKVSSISPRRYFRLESGIHENYTLKSERDPPPSDFLQSISAVKTTVEGSISNDLETSAKGAGKFFLLMMSEFHRVIFGSYLRVCS